MKSQASNMDSKYVFRHISGKNRRESQLLIVKCCFMLFNTFANPFIEEIKTMGNTALRPLATFFSAS